MFGQSSLISVILILEFQSQHSTLTTQHSPESSISSNRAQRQLFEWPLEWVFDPVAIEAAFNDIGDRPLIMVVLLGWLDVVTTISLRYSPDVLSFSGGKTR